MNIYIASKTKHADRWRTLRKALKSDGINIISTWIDEAGEGESADLTDLAIRCIQEASCADRLILYSEEGEILKGALIECGAALAFNKQVFAIGPCVGVHSAFRSHPMWRDCDDVALAICLPDEYL
jgi:hypothetical protein